MNCVECKEFLIAYIERLLGERQQQAITAHLKGCSACRAELKELIDIHNRLARNGKALAQVDIEDDVMAKINQIRNARSEAATAATSGLALRRKTMKSPILRLAAAAVIIIAVTLAFLLPGSRGVAIAEVLERVEQIKTFAYRMKMDMEKMPVAETGQIKNLEMNAVVAKDIGMRMDAYIEGKLISQTYVLLSEETIYSVICEEKKYMRINLTDEILEKMQKDNGDPRAWLEEFEDNECTQLGESIIDGIKVKGVESRDPNIAEGMLGDAVARIWVDTEDELPVRFEIELFSKDGDKMMEMVIYDFQWDIEIPETELALNIPEDYEMLAEVDLSASEENLVEGLGFFAELSGGRYPSDLSVMKVSQELQEVLLTTGEMLNREPSKEEIQKLVNLQMGATAFSAMRSEGKDPAYYGDRVTTEFPHAVLMRWKDDDGTYRVFFGDLSARNVTREELDKLEAVPLNLKPKAIKPYPTDGAEGTALTGLGLSWMPGAYATAHRVYFGTDAGQLTLLGEITTESAEPAALQRAATYYWRVDEVQADGSIAAGDIWSFNTGRLVAHWKLDDGSGTAAFDSSGNGYDGELIGDAAWTTGRIGGALVFDGNEDHVEITDSNELVITDQITVAAWIKVDAFDKQWQAIVTKGDSSWRLQRNAGKSGLEFACSGLLIPGNRWGSIYGAVDVNDGRWHHATGVYDGETLSLYIDGALDVSAEATGKIGQTDKMVLIGENCEKRGRCWNGLIDDVRIYSYGMTAEEVAALAEE